MTEATKQLRKWCPSCQAPVKGSHSSKQCAKKRQATEYNARYERRLAKQAKEINLAPELRFERLAEAIERYSKR